MALPAHVAEQVEQRVAKMVARKNRRDRNPRSRCLRVVYPYRKARGPNGRGLCRYCGEEVPAGRRTWCSDDHVKAALLTCDPATQRREVYRRDQGVCQFCGTETDDLYWLVRDMVDRDMQAAGETSRVRYQFGQRVDGVMRALGYNGGCESWEMHHIVPVCEGGAALGLDNLITLCVPCHKRETALAAKRRAWRGGPRRWPR